MPQIFVLPRQLALDDDANPLAGALLYFFQTSTTTPQNVYSDAALTTAHSHPVVADSSGEFPKIYLSAAATANYRVRLTTADGVQLYQEDDIDRFVISDAEVAAALYFRSDAEIAAGIVPSNFLYPVGNVLRYGAVGNGVSDDSAAFQRALDVGGNDDSIIGPGLPAGMEGKGIEVVVPPGIYKVSGVTVWNGTYLVGSGRTSTILVPATASTYVVKIVGSHGGIRHLTIDNKNSVSGVTGLGIVPLDESNLAGYRMQNFNHIEDLFVLGCANGILLRCGPDVGGGDSGCWYNTFHHVTISQCDRALWLREGPNASASGANRNTFHACRFGQNPCSVGIWNDDANTNMFTDCSFEGITTAGVLATPTAIYMPNAAGPTSGSSAGLNKFVSCEIEGVTRAYDVVVGGEWLWVGGDLAGYPGNGQAPNIWLDVKRVQFAKAVRITEQAPATPLADALYANLIPKAWALFDGRSGTFTQFSGVNVTVTRNGTGDYTCTITTDMVGTNSYIAIATADSALCEIATSGKTAGAFNLLTFDYARSATESPRVNVVVFGSQS